MDAEAHSTSTSSIASALASGTTSPATGLVLVNPKSGGLLEAAVPMVIVQQFIEDNKEKGMPGNQKMADLKEEKRRSKLRRKRLQRNLGMKKGNEAASGIVLKSYRAKILFKSSPYVLRRHR